MAPVSFWDLLLRRAARGLYRPIWSERILEETFRAMADIKDAVRAQPRVDAMRQAFPSAIVAGFEHHEPDLTNHPKDRHVVAAALGARASMIVTADLKDFPPTALDPYRIAAVSPDRFLGLLLRDAPDTMVDVVVRHAAELKNPPISVGRLLGGIARDAPAFAAAIGARLAEAY